MALYCFAGLNVEMEPQFTLARQRAEAYRVNDGTADLTVVGGGADAFEEYAQLARSFYSQLLRFDGFLFHASVVEWNGKAYAFSAKSGTGKSTHTAFWETEFGAVVINDDKPAIRLIDGKMCACGTPFSGKNDKSKNVCVPLGGVVFLQRSDENRIRRISTKEALPMLFSQTVHPAYTDDPAHFLRLVDRLLNTVPFYVAGCTNDPSAAHVMKQAIVTI